MHWKNKQNRTDETPKKKKMNIMINFDEVTGENIQEPNSQWLQIFDNPYRILIVDDSGSGKINALFNLTNHQPDYFHEKDPYEPKYDHKHSLITRHIH